MYRFWVYLHIAGVFGFLLAHGVSTFVAFRLRREHEVERIRALAELSSSTLGVFYVSLFALLVGGVVAGFVGHWWGDGWIWAAIGTLLAIMVAMYAIATPWLERVRLSVGVQRFDPAKLKPKQRAKLEAKGRLGSGMPGTPQEIAAAVSSSRPFVLLVVGGGGLLAILWLMVFKPF
jgi:MFS family permease